MENTWENSCRACLTSKKSFSYFLFDNVSPETYLFCTSIQIKEDESLPKALCEVCYGLINKYSKFKQTCIESQNALLRKIKIKEEATVFIEENDDPTVEPNYESQDETVDQPERKYSYNGQQLQNKIVEYTAARREENDVKQEALSDHLSEDSMDAEYAEPQTEIEDPIRIEKSDWENNVDCGNLKKNESKKNLKKLKHRKIKRENLELLRKQLFYSCQMCNKKFKYHKRFEAHKLEHIQRNTQTSRQCASCSKTFMTASGLKRHEQSEHTCVRLASVACKRCGRVCASKHSLQVHEKAHGTVRAHSVCHICGKRVSTPVILRAHLETHKADRERRHTCEHCGKKFFTNTMLFSHIKRLHSGLRFICGICNYPFTDKYNLAKHILIHDGKKLFKCDICDKSYSANASLVEHKRTHSGERPFVCSFCPKSFSSRRRLLEHQRIHTGDKPHKCGVCEQRFTQRGTLNRHMKVHDPMKISQVV